MKIEREKVRAFTHGFLQDILTLMSVLKTDVLKKADLEQIVKIKIERKAKGSHLNRLLPKSPLIYNFYKINRFYYNFVDYITYLLYTHGIILRRELLP